ncbi:serine/threonine-protein kinase, partial [Paludisphaera soli]|uniref:serine/threonine-protein kinase n=1 Tax=Paludisphaera soli TaxID=2712865 RepID=UPI0013EB8604
MTEESLFAEALERTTPDERRAYLEEACAGDPALRARVERLLAAYEGAGGLLDAPPSASPAGRGATIAGRYELVEVVGEGGMGTVWLAEQTRPVRRRVALKLIRPGMDSRSILARFEAERQALALMDHPNIARVFDGGTTEDGRPFFVMEYVEGAPLTEYCDRARLDVGERLDLFIAVCRAVQHAHTKGVVHRDLKPSNILVGLCDGRPTPKVIDFGLAKATRRPLVESSARTAPDAAMGTPLYMSPEQAAPGNVDVDARADVYALGVILYELLTGTTPLERPHLREAAWHEVLRRILEEDPPRPSVRLGGSEALPSVAALRRLEPVRLARLVRGDLDWIVMKCLEKDRSRRYETPLGLARDVERYLHDESVEASPPSTGYRLGKFLRRNRGPVAAIATIFLLLVVGVVGTTWGLIRAERAWRAEAGRAESERIANANARKRLEQVRQGSEILASVFDDLDPREEEKDDRPLRAVLGDRLALAAVRLEGEGMGDPLLVAGLQDRLGRSLVHLGLAGKAVPLLEKAHATRAAELGSDHPDALESLNNLAEALGSAG